GIQNGRITTGDNRSQTIMVLRLHKKQRGDIVNKLLPRQCYNFSPCIFAYIELNKNYSRVFTRRVYALIFATNSSFGKILPLL
ncbi:MAG: hypothetical protein WCC17_22155, partial [Candidatus Nitrosopolaris sp.]